MTQDTANFLQTLERPLTADPCQTTHLFATNYEVDLHNSKTLNCLPDDPMIYTAVDKNVSKQFESACPVPKNLKLKVGAKVLLCMSLSKTMCSGMMGDVVVCAPNRLSVKISNRTLEFDRVNFVYPGVSGTRHQYPFRLAFALTVHRAQGLTLNNVAVHAAKMKWPGQLGVAVGRAKYSHGIQMIGWDKNLKITSQPEEVIGFYDQVPISECQCFGEEHQTQSTLSENSSQATVFGDVQEHEHVTSDIDTDLDNLCPIQEEHELAVGSKAFNTERNRLLSRPQQLKDFVHTIKHNMSCKLIAFKQNGKFTNKKQTAFFADTQEILTSERYIEQVSLLFGKRPNKARFSVAFTIFRSIRDILVKAALSCNEDLQSFLPAPSSDVSMSNIKYIAGFCIYGVRKKKRGAVRQSIRSKRSKHDPVAIVQSFA